MKNKKGFTLAELLAVIVILGIIAALATPAIMSIYRRNQERLYCTKISILEADAVTWGERNLDSLPVIEEGQAPNNITPNLTVERLVQDRITSPDDEETGFVLDPRTNEPINEYRIRVYLRWDKIYAQIIDVDPEAC